MVRRSVQARHPEIQDAANLENVEGEGYRARGRARLPGPERHCSRLAVGNPVLRANPVRGSGQLHLSLAPSYDAAAAFSAVLVLQGTYPRPIQAFLESCVAAKAPTSQWRSIKTRYDVLIEGWQTKMEFDSWFRVEAADAEDRISRGEEPEAIFEDIQRRFEARYGEDADVEPQGTPSTSADCAS